MGQTDSQQPSSMSLARSKENALSGAKIVLHPLSSYLTTFSSPNVFTVPVTFMWPFGAQNSVYVAGSYNNWGSKVPLEPIDNPEADSKGPTVDDLQFGQYTVHQIDEFKSLTKDKTASLSPWHKTWMITIPLPVGQHYYKYIVDGEWRYDPRYHTGPDRNGSLVNSIIIAARPCCLSWPSERLALHSMRNPLLPAHTPPASANTPSSFCSSSSSASLPPSMLSSSSSALCRAPSGPALPAPASLDARTPSQAELAERRAYFFLRRLKCRTFAPPHTPARPDEEGSGAGPGGKGGGAGERGAEGYTVHELDASVYARISVLPSDLPPQRNVIPLNSIARINTIIATIVRPLAERGEGAGGASGAAGGRSAGSHRTRLQQLYLPSVQLKPSRALSVLASAATSTRNSPLRHLPTSVDPNLLEIIPHIHFNHLYATTQRLAHRPHRHPKPAHTAQPALLHAQAGPGAGEAGPATARPQRRPHPHGAGRGDAGLLAPLLGAEEPASVSGEEQAGPWADGAASYVAPQLSAPSQDGPGLTEIKIRVGGPGSAIVLSYDLNDLHGPSASIFAMTLPFTYKTATVILYSPQLAALPPQMDQAVEQASSLLLHKLLRAKREAKKTGLT